MNPANHTQRIPLDVISFHSYASYQNRTAVDKYSSFFGTCSHTLLEDTHKWLLPVDVLRDGFLHTKHEGDSWCGWTTLSTRSLPIGLYKAMMGLQSVLAFSTNRSVTNLTGGLYGSEIIVQSGAALCITNSSQLLQAKHKFGKV